MTLPWQRGIAVDAPPSRLPLLEAIEARGPRDLPVVYGERSVAEVVTCCPSCGAGSRLGAPGETHLRGCPEVQPCEHVMPGDA